MTNKEKLKVSEVRLTAFQESAPNGFVLYDSELNLMDINKAGLKIFPTGTKKEDILGKNIAEISPNIKDTGRYDKYLEVLRTGKAFSIDNLVPHPKFGDIYLDVRAFKAGDDLGIIYIDITEHKKVEKVLQQQQDWLKGTLSSIGDAVITTDINAKITFMNPVAERLTRWTAPEALGQNSSEIFRVVNEQTRQIVENPVDRVLKEGTIVGLANHTVLIARDGRETPIDDSGAPIKSEDDKLLGVVLVFRDITDKKRAEIALKTSEERLIAFKESAPNGFMLYDSELNLMDINKAGLKIFSTGTKKEDILGKNIVDIAPNIKETGRYDKYLEVLGTGNPFFADDLVPHPKFGNIHLSVKAFKVGDDLGIIYSDITEREKLKELLIQKERLAVLGQLAGGIGHELRNPLGAIKNAAFFLNMVLEKPDSDIKESLTIIDEEVNNSERIINSLLDYARPKPINFQKTDIVEVIRESLSSVIIHKNITVNNLIIDELPFIQADPNQLSQVFNNLIYNAVQSMPNGGDLLLKAKCQNQKLLAISVKDTGVGISEENMERLFEPLFTTKAKGIGLGLAISKTIVENHHGTIHVQSELGKGATFTVEIPLQHIEDN